MDAFSLPRSERLAGSRQFAAVFQEGRRYGSRMLTMRARRNGLGHIRLGLAVRRGTDGAVGRNRTKRRLREAMRLARPELPAGLDVVLMPTKGTIGASMEELRVEVIGLCTRAANDPGLASPDANTGTDTE